MDKDLYSITKALHKREKEDEIFHIEKYLFPEQLAFARDPSRFKVACCARQTGKSFVLAYLMILAALGKPKVDVYYIGPTEKDVKEIIIPELDKINEGRLDPSDDSKSLWNLNMIIRRREAWCTLPNGSNIYLKSYHDASQIEALRGRKMALVVIDEAQIPSDSNLRKLLLSVLQPSLMKHKASCIVVGTPGAIPSGYFYDMTQGYDSKNKRPMKYSAHHWIDNPFIPDREEQIREIMELNGWSEKSPTFRREYRGEWVHDVDALVFKYDDQRNGIDSAPGATDWVFYLGVDVGATEKSPCAFAVVGYSPKLRNIVVFETMKDDMDSTEIAQWIRDYFRVKYDIRKVIMDTGGMGSIIAKDWIRNYPDIPVFRAIKTGKLFQSIYLMNDHFISGRLLVLRGGNEDFLDEMSKLEWDSASLLGNQPEPNEKQPDHICDAVRYCHREIFIGMAHPKVEAPEVGTREYHDLVMRNHIDRIIRAERSDPDFSDDGWASDFRRILE